MSTVTQNKRIKYKLILLLAGIVLLGGPVPVRAAEPSKPDATSLGTGFMIRVATQPLLLAVSVEPLHLRFVGKGARLPNDYGVYRAVQGASVPRALQGLKGCSSAGLIMYVKICALTYFRIHRADGA